MFKQQQQQQQQLFYYHHHYHHYHHHLVIIIIIIIVKDLYGLDYLYQQTAGKHSRAAIRTTHRAGSCWSNRTARLPPSGWVHTLLLHTPLKIRCAPFWVGTCPFVTLLKICLSSGKAGSYSFITPLITCSLLKGWVHFYYTHDMICRFINGYIFRTTWMICPFLIGPDVNLCGRLGSKHQLTN